MRARYRLLDALEAIRSPLATLRRIRENAQVAREIAKRQHEELELIGMDDEKGRVLMLYKLRDEEPPWSS